MLVKFSLPAPVAVSRNPPLVIVPPNDNVPAVELNDCAAFSVRFRLTFAPLLLLLTIPPLPMVMALPPTVSVTVGVALNVIEISDKLLMLFVELLLALPEANTTASPFTGAVPPQLVPVAHVLLVAPLQVR